MCSRMGQAEIMMDGIIPGTKGCHVEPFERTKVPDEVNRSYRNTYLSERRVFMCMNLT
ncbi:hypothetical protein JZ785_20140 [Alicyclobacillus curvatus]|nr:hypothetical protein JZ785_20140 [Alicyclobacillus curvatus]